MLAGRLASSRLGMQPPPTAMLTGPVFSAGPFVGAAPPLASDKPPRLQKHHLVLGFRPTSLLLAMGRREAGTARCAQERLHAGGAFATPTETDAQKI
jgi:hypothetical protein